MLRAGLQHCQVEDVLPGLPMNCDWHLVALPLHQEVEGAVASLAVLNYVLDESKFKKF